MASRIRTLWLPVAWQCRPGAGRRADSDAGTWLIMMMPVPGGLLGLRLGREGVIGVPFRCAIVLKGAVYE